jgi:hypothetical protein
MLFVDDYDILYRSGPRRVLQPLEHHPIYLILPGRDKPWEAANVWTSSYPEPVTCCAAT